MERSFLQEFKERLGRFIIRTFVTGVVVGGILVFTAVIAIDVYVTSNQPTQQTYDPPAAEPNAPTPDNPATECSPAPGKSTAVLSSRRTPGKTRGRKATSTTVAAPTATLALANP